MKKELKKKGETPSNPHLFLIDYLESNYDLRYNILLKEVVDMRTHGTTVDATDIWDSLMCEGHKYSIGYVNSMLSVRKRIREINPIVEYFENLPAWEGNDHISNVLNMVKLQEGQNRKLFDLHHKKFFMRCVNTVMGGGQNKNSPVWVGGQNAGKTSFQKALCPLVLKKYRRIYEAGDEISEQDIYKKFWLIIDDFTKLGMTSLNILKSKMSSEDKPMRIDGETREMKRMAALFFNSNNTHILNDPTGHTRFQPWLIQECDFNSLKAYDIEQFWAQVLHLWKHAIADKDLYRFLVTKAEDQELDKLREYFTIVSREQNLIKDFIEISTKDDPDAMHMNTTELCALFKRELGINSNPNTLGRELNKIGFKTEGKYSPDVKWTRTGYYFKFKK